MVYSYFIMIIEQQNGRYIFWLHMFFNNSFYIALYIASINWFFWTSFLFSSSEFLTYWLDFSLFWPWNYQSSTSTLATRTFPSFWLFVVPFRMLWMVVTVNKPCQNLFANSWVNITAEGKIHRGAVIGSTELCDKYVKNLAKDWEKQLIILSTIAETQPQAAYTAFVSGLKSQLNYFLRTISNIRHLLLPHMQW